MSYPDWFALDTTVPYLVGSYYFLIPLHPSSSCFLGSKVSLSEHDSALSLCLGRGLARTSCISIKRLLQESNKISPASWSRCRKIFVWCLTMNRNIESPAFLQAIPYFLKFFEAQSEQWCFINFPGIGKRQFQIDLVELKNWFLLSKSQ